MGETEDYNFDFVNDASAMKLAVGDTEYEAVKISENEYGFAQDEGGIYRYALEYDANSDSFTWFFHTSVVGQEVSLTYKVQLANPKTEPGVYDGLLTNNEANLYPSGSSEVIPFPQPTISYEVIADEPVPVDPDGKGSDANHDSGVVKADEAQPATSLPQTLIGHPRPPSRLRRPVEISRVCVLRRFVLFGILHVRASQRSCVPTWLSW